MGWYASDNNLRGTPRGRRKNPKAGRSSTCHLWTTDANSHMPWHARAALCRALRSRFQNGKVVTWHGRGMACVNQTRPLCVNQMGKSQYKPLAVWYGRGAEWEQHGNGMGTTSYVWISLYSPAKANLKSYNSITNFQHDATLNCKLHRKKTTFI
jgi:hypothetical protein